ncbi:reverse transcriptase [Plakobranchus ocellatus]|uniref:Reverse transcriptase n=1 Tax=Plakobranchus ocellatus TaxID=259542 RepID=A0AAV4AYD0_9GAST|nr:reverse transcriptase [Plakobranchus ocellatus]
MRGKKLKSKKVAPLEDQNNSKVAVNDKDKAELLSKQFEFISSDENLEPEFREIKEKAKKDKYKLLAKEVCRHNIEYYNLPISLKEMQEVLDNKKKSAPGEDAITYEIINQTPPSFKLKILALFNAIWISGDIPEQFKHAVVIPIYKQGKDKKDPASYRPIDLSLTSHLGKVLETIINKRLTYHLEANNLLSDTQAGFRKDRQTLDQIVALEN